MKRLALIIALVCASCAHHPEPLTSKEITAIAAWECMHIVDWGQTLNIASDERYYEINPIMGHRPSRGRVNAHMAATAILHPIITYMLPQKYRKYWLWSSLSVTGSFIAHNHKIGLRMDF